MRGAQQPLERPRERVGGRLVAREHECQELVAELLIGHRRAVLVARREQQRENIRAALDVARAAARGDHRIEMAVEPANQLFDRTGGFGAADGQQFDDLREGLRGEVHDPADRVAETALGGALLRAAIDAEDPGHDHVEGDHSSQGPAQRARPAASARSPARLPARSSRCSAPPPRRGTAAVGAYADAYAGDPQA